MTLYARWSPHFSVDIHGTEATVNIIGFWADCQSRIYFEGQDDAGILVTDASKITHDYKESWSGIITVTSFFDGNPYTSSLPVSVIQGSDVKDTCTVIVDADDRSPTYTVKLSYGELMPEPATPERYGYTFLGWYADGEPWYFNNNMTRDMVLRVQWECYDYGVPDTEEVFEVIYTGYGSDIGSEYVPYGGKATRPMDPAREGFLFTGWRTSDGVEWDYLNDPVTDDTILVSSWVPVGDVAVSGYGVTVSLDGRLEGSILLDWGDGSYYVTDGGQLTVGHAYSESGAKEIHVTAWIDGTPISAVLTADISSSHAPKPLDCDVTFECDDYSFTTTMIRGEAVNEPPMPTDSNLVFVGWYAGSEWDFDDEVTSDLVLKAKWVSPEDL